MACGLPCVSTDVGDAAALIGETGALVPKAEPPALAEKLRELLELAPEARLARGALARRRVEENFSLQAIVARYAALFHELGASSCHSG
jgi:glycosyltransferase involved in cell wall biosynthesis